MKNLTEKSNRPKIVGNITDEAVQKYIKGQTEKL